MSETTTVRPGQVWADNDARCEGRTVRVDSVDDTYAYCTVLTNIAWVQRRIDAGHTDHADKRNATARLMLRRMRPTSSGYRLVDDGEG
jgi:hypothetical protein